jgi:predicted transposase YdaD
MQEGELIMTDREKAAKQFQGSKRKGREAAWQKRQAEKAEEQRLLKIINSRESSIEEVASAMGISLK